MNKVVCIFKVDDNGRVVPNPQQIQFLQSTYSKAVLEILGRADSSLISINEVADFFDLDADAEYEWKFIPTQMVDDNMLLARIKYS